VVVMSHLASGDRGSLSPHQIKPHILVRIARGDEAIQIHARSAPGLLRNKGCTGWSTIPWHSNGHTENRSYGRHTSRFLLFEDYQISNASNSTIPIPTTSTASATESCSSQCSPCCPCCMYASPFPTPVWARGPGSDNASGRLAFPRPFGSPRWEHWGAGRPGLIQNNSGLPKDLASPP
jgi:hypothetical protein